MQSLTTHRFVAGTPAEGDGRSRDALSHLVVPLLACGILSMLIYVAIDLFAASQWAGYRIADRAVSELLAVGSPTRGLVLVPMALYNLLVGAFGIGVWLAAGGRRWLRVTSVLLIVYSIASLAGLLLFPLRPDSGVSAAGAMPLSGVLHVAITSALVLLMFAFIGTGSGAAGRAFRWYSIATIAVVFAGGLFAGSQVQRVAAGAVVHGLGLLERANIYSSLLWVAVLAIVLLVRESRNREALGAASAIAGNSDTNPA